MADRGALYLREVEDFATWAVGLGCTRMLVTNPYELLRLELPESLRRPGVPMRARYRYTHWVASVQETGGVTRIFDVNWPRTWLGLEAWRDHLVPRLLKDVKRAASRPCSREERDAAFNEGRTRT